MSDRPAQRSQILRNTHLPSSHPTIAINHHIPPPPKATSTIPSFPSRSPASRPQNHCSPPPRECPYIRCILGLTCLRRPSAEQGPGSAIRETDKQRRSAHSEDPVPSGFLPLHIALVRCLTRSIGVLSLSLPFFFFITWVYPRAIMFGGPISVY